MYYTTPRFEYLGNILLPVYICQSITGTVLKGEFVFPSHLLTEAVMLPVKNTEIQMLSLCNF